MVRGVAQGRQWASTAMWVIRGGGKPPGGGGNRAAHGHRRVSSSPRAGSNFAALSHGASAIKSGLGVAMGLFATGAAVAATGNSGASAPSPEEREARATGPLPKGLEKLKAMSNEQKHPSCLWDTPWLSRLVSAQDSIIVEGGGAAKEVANLPGADDHMFLAMKRSGQLRSYTCIYERSAGRYHTVFDLGGEVCGFPSVVHGGLSASICDETLGGLLFALKMEGDLPRGPAFTARLEVDYRKRVPAESLVVCTAELIEVDGRKVWMKCALHDGNGPGEGEGKVFVEGKALFVHPRTDKMVKEAVKMGPKIVAGYVADKLGGGR
ncbi:unnamed protein product [Pedinophyceae sp. YPF-701]|nr:unnamed protein product [Pedinophyceae sp. YPF-701]